jgi:hypothetical protein
MPAITPEPIMKVAMGFMAAKHLFAASETALSLSTCYGETIR